MKKSNLKMTVRFFIFLLYFTTQTIAFGGVVLCQGSDGHIHIEFANGGHCTELPLGDSDGHKHSHSSEHSILPCELSPCGDCEDIPLVFLSNNEALKKSTTPGKASAQRTFPPFFANHNKQKPFAPALLPRISPDNNFPCILQKTTVLLI